MKSLTAIFVTCLIAGCTNSINYHHSERTSIALETRTTDPQQPIQGIIGVKTRTIIVTPGKKQTTSGSDSSENGESTSVVSDFNLQRDPKGFFEFGSTSIQSAFITGDAAVNSTAQTIEALSGVGYGSIDNKTVKLRSLLKNIYDILDKIKAEDVNASQHLFALDALAKLVPEDVRSRVYYIKNGNVLEQHDLAGLPTTFRNFKDVMKYDGVLNTSIKGLSEMEADRSVMFKDSNGTNVITAAKLLTLKEEKSRLKKEREQFFRLIGNHNAIDAAAAYAVSLL